MSRSPKPDARNRGKRRWIVRYRLGGREAAVVHGGSFLTEREARVRRDWIAGELAAGRGDVEAQRGHWRVTQAVSKTSRARWVQVPPDVFAAALELAVSPGRCSLGEDRGARRAADLAVTANTYTDVLVDERELEYARMVT